MYHNNNNRKWSDNGNTVEKKIITKRITLVTIMFIVIWLLPLLERMYIP